MHHVWALCVKDGLFKTVVDGQLVDMEEASPEVEVLKDVETNNLIPEAQEDEHHDVWVCFMFVA